MWSASTASPARRTGLFGADRSAERYAELVQELGTTPQKGPQIAIWQRKFATSANRAYPGFLALLGGTSPEALDLQAM